VSSWKLTRTIDIDSIIEAIEKVRQPSDIKNNEEDIIQGG
jgi:hypothetical protein